MGQNITVLGAGAGGLAATADLTLLGHDVTLFELPEFESNLDAIRANGGIDISGAASEGHAEPASVTSDPAAAVADADLILQAVPNFAFRAFAETVGPHLSEGQALVLLSANTMSALEYRRLLDAVGAPEIRLGEAPSLAYAVRKTSPSSVNVLGFKKKLTVAGLPASHTDDIVDLLDAAFPVDIEPAASVLETSLYNANPVIHPVGALLNAGEIESPDDDYYLYQNVTDSIGRVMMKVDEERIAIGEALGYDIQSLGEIFHDWYGIGENEYYATTVNSLRTSSIHGPIQGPDSLDHRYVTEDVPYGLVPLSEMGDAAGVETPTIDSLITIADVVHHTDYRADGRTLDECGVKTLDKNTLVNAATLSDLHV
ncbi:NAD/NADP octopine/nopaline dehydrogenase family protein [Haloferax sp. YSSS75]|uniref:NAD/NADP octopine/nopaline dehydrogenase family protein n=1 Tax=Haloferax sp. YSSS75 TaxID=3388564 RepID=UPI00398CF0DC